MYTLPFPFAIPNGCTHAESPIMTSIFRAACDFSDNPHTKNRSSLGAGLGAGQE